MLSTSLCAVLISFVVAVVAQVLYKAKIISVDSRNLCLTVLGIWIGILCAVFIFGVSLIFRGNF